MPSPKDRAGSYHAPRQVVGPDHLVREQNLERGVDGAQQPIAEMRFLPRLYWIDKGVPKDVD